MMSRYRGNGAIAGRIDGELRLRNRDKGGFDATLILPAIAPSEPAPDPDCFDDSSCSMERIAPGIAP